MFISKQCSCFHSLLSPSHFWLLGHTVRWVRKVLTVGSTPGWFINIQYAAGVQWTLYTCYGSGTFHGLAPSCHPIYVLIRANSNGWRIDWQKVISVLMFKYNPETLSCYIKLINVKTSWTYCLPKKSWPILCSKLLYKMDQGFFKRIRIEKRNWGFKNHFPQPTFGSVRLGEVGYVIGFFNPVF